MNNAIADIANAVTIALVLEFLPLLSAEANKIQICNRKEGLRVQ